MIEIQDILTKKFLEKGVSNIILDYKKYIEWGEFINEYEAQQKNISRHNLSEDFIRDFQHKINYSLILDNELMIKDDDKDKWDNIPLSQKNIRRFYKRFST